MSLLKRAPGGPGRTYRIPSESTHQLPLARKILLIQGRNFGDSVVVTGLVEALGRSLRGAEISVLTRPHFKEIYERNPFVSRMHYANFPMGTDKRFGVRAAVALLWTLASLRLSGFTDVLHATGDFRETFLGWLVAPSGNRGLVWDEGNPQALLTRGGLSALLKSAVAVPAETENYYAVIEHFAAALGAREPAHPRLYGRDGAMLMHRPQGRSIGFHMSASQPNKLWPAQNWRSLLMELRSRGYTITVFGAPDEREQIVRDLGGAVDEGVELITGSLDQFFEGLSRVRAVVCLDSFSIHAAYAIGVPGVMINGANRAAMWLPPGFELVDGGRGLACAPCLNVPTCEQSDRPYQCMKDIPVEAVLEAVERLGMFTPL